MASSSTLASLATSTSAVRLRHPRRCHTRAVVKAATASSSATGADDATGVGVGSVGSVGSVGNHQIAAAVLKKQLLAAVAASRKPGADPFASKRQILDAVSALEALGAMKGDDDDAARTNGKPARVPFADISGRWSLVYSTNDDSGSLSPLAAVLDEDTFQRVSNQLYKLFFSSAPALAGSAETGAKGVSNEQIVDLANGVVVNNVDVELPWPFDGAVVRVGVSGEVEAVDAEAREVMVTFTEWEVGPAGNGGTGGSQPPWLLRLPLPRPRGFLKNTFCDDTLRLSRGGRGGVFITSRLPSASSSTSSGYRGL